MQSFLKAFTIALALTPSISSASEIVIGRWCDVLVPNSSFTRTMTLVIVPDGSLVFRHSFSDGSSGEYEMVELGNETYAEVEAEFGQKYRIVQSSGDLQLLDEDGLIRIARRLENAPRTGEC